jgi:hypothetical protein
LSGQRFHLPLDCRTIPFFAHPRIGRHYVAWDAARPAGRCFLGALADVAGSESGAKTSLARMQTFRVIMGPKPFATLAKTHADDAAMQAYFKRGVMPGLLSRWLPGSCA